jgi:hypothetical protein
MAPVSKRIQELRKVRQMIDKNLPSVEHLVVTKKDMHWIRDIAHKVFIERTVNDMNLLMLYALETYMKQRGASTFEVQLDKKGEK